MRHTRNIGRFAATLVLGAALAAPMRGGAQAPAANQPDVQPLRVCADPDNLPFSSAKSETPGLYVELGQQIAQALGRPYESVWSLSYFGKRAVRTTLLAKACDIYVGLPNSKGFMGPQLIFSKPFLQVGYAIMAPSADHIVRLDDLSGKRVAVQFATPPQLLLAKRDDVRSVTFLNPEEAAKALARHDVDAAFIWGPTAGYINATALQGAYQVIPISGEGMQYPVAIGYREANAELRDQVDRAIDNNRPGIAGLAAKYGLPTAAPITLASLAPPMVVLASTSETEAAPPASVASPSAEAAPAPSAEAAAKPSNEPASDGDPAEVAEGRKIFNGTCSHCHGPDAVQSVKRIDLRLLRHRYGEGTESVYHETVVKGRPAKGMPNWSKVFTEDDFKKIYAYLSTIQSD
jgi:polar amino acid transport system substrate-binding protein